MIGRAHWLVLCIESSYPIAERWEVTEAVRDYLAWLDSLPVIEGIPNA